ncbi:MAG: hypothetical protein K2X47_04020, partial [Bdellovibrionales bacterium]|nr:hypothetical protein [Bdellovibrionales bacterium]
MNKYFVSLIICATTQTGSFAASANADNIAVLNAQKTTNLTVDEVAERVGKFNLSVYANALKVYQAKESIQVARGNLLPKLNLWRLAGNFNGVSPVMSLANTAGSLIEVIAPFLVPATWFRLKQVKL